MIEVFKILTGKYDSLISPHLPLSSSSVTRGNSFKIITRRCHYDLRKYSFCNQVTNIWNSLPNDVVNASSLNVFKNRLDTHLIYQDAMYCTIGMLISREPEVEVILLVKLHAIHFYSSSLFKIWA